MSDLETELTKALEDAAQLEERNSQLSEQLSGVREKVSIRTWTLRSFTSITERHDEEEVSF